LRKQIVSSLIVSLLHIENNADADNAADNVSKGLRKVSSFTAMVQMLVS